MRCRNCHYSLVGLTEHRCPECEAAFDPNDSNSWLTERQITTDRRQRVVAIAGMGLALLTILILAAVTQRPIILVFMLPSLVLVSVMTWIHSTAKRRDRQTKG